MFPQHWQALMREERDAQMRRGIQKILILLAVFIVALFTFSKLTNHETKDLTADLAAPTLRWFILRIMGIH